MLCVNVHASRDWQLASRDVIVQVTGLFHELNVDFELFHRLKTLVAAARRAPDRNDAALGDVDWRMADAMLHEFSRNGIDLDDATRAAVRALNNELTELSLLLGESLGNENDVDMDSDGSGATARGEQLRRQRYLRRLSNAAAVRRVELFEKLLVRPICRC